MLPLLGVRTILLFVYVSACWESDRSYDLLCSLWEPAGFGGLESTLIFWHPMLGDNSVMTGPWSLMYSSSKSRYASERGRLRWLSTWDLVIRLASDLASGGSFASSQLITGYHAGALTHTAPGQSGLAGVVDTLEMKLNISICSLALLTPRSFYLF